MILQSLKRLQEKNKSKTRATFWQTVEAVSKQNKVGKEEVTSSLRTLIAKGYIYQVKESEKPDSIRILKVNWQQVYKDRLL
jgi:competence protein ComGC